MDDAREILQTERREALERLEDLTRSFDDVVAASRDANADDEHDPEGATIAYERAQVSALADQAREQLAEIDAALARVDDGSYGVCGGCGQAIGAGRLEARPVTRLCIRCASLRSARGGRRG